MADELNIPTHRWYQKRNHIALAKEDFSRQFIYDSGIQKIDAWINSQPWGDVYIVNRLSPPLVLDFIEDYYRTGGSASTFDDALNFSRAGNATMVDSDGVLKWAPHNLYAPQSGIANNITISGASGDYTYTETAATDARYRQRSIILAVGVATTVKFKVKQGDRRYFISKDSSNVGVVFDLLTGTISATNGALLGTPTISPATGGYYECEYSFKPFGDILDFQASEVASIDDTYTSAGGLIAFYLRDAHVYRSDLGGMVDNPATGNSYVPTTDSARYLPRVGNHVYNGSEWVNEGLLLESEARTQLLHTTDALVTQSKTVTAVPHTLHFTGTGTVTLSGASTSGPLVGTGTGENNRVSLTFTPTAASLTLTVSGTVADAQLEVGSTPSSYIPNLAASGEVTRAAETLDVAAADMPWPEPVVIGEELVTNGTFDSDSDWNKNSSWTISGGVATLTAPTGDISLSQVVNPTSGSVYKVEFDLSGRTAGDLFIRLGGTTNLAGTFTTNTRHTVYVVAEGANTLLLFIPTGIFDGAIDNISVREINPLAVSIQMDGAMTYADEDEVTGVSFYDWAVDANNNLASIIRTTNTPINWRATQAESGVFDSVLQSPADYSPGINVPYNIASRHGSTFINGAVDGTALTENDTPTALPDLSATDFDIAPTFMGNIGKLRVWAEDLTDEGIEEASA